MTRTKSPHGTPGFPHLGRPERVSLGDGESQIGRGFLFGEECFQCNGTGKLDQPGGPDCPNCKGIGVREVSFPGYPENETKVGS
jgi:hypothetical protein